MAFVLACSADPGTGGACPPEASAWVDLAALVTPDVLGVDAESIAFAFGWGFGAVVLMWFGGYVIGVALTAIRKA